ncbi:MAG: hypothetical protein RLY95_1129 [Pseudomonadota bacterium]
MQIGDHLVTPRRGYMHHGIYVGGGMVIHYGGYTKGKADGIIVVTTLDEFAQGNGYLTVKHWFRRFSALRSVERALSRLGERRYGLVFNNCESFVSWCIWGVRFSSQVSKGMLCLALVAGALIRVAA